MADTGVYATTAQVQYKVGSGASTIANAETALNEYIGQAEGVINVLCRKVFASTSGAFVALPAGTRGMITDAATNLAAIYAISYDMAGRSRGEMEDRIVILRDGFLRDISILRDKKMQDFVTSGVEN